MHDGLTDVPVAQAVTRRSRKPTPSRYGADPSSVYAVATVDAIDQSFGQLQTAVGQSLQTMQALGTKLQTAADGGDANAREWGLDLRELALGLKEEQQQLNALLQALHDFVVANAHQAVATAAPVAPASAPVQAVPVAPVQSQGVAGFMGGGGGGGLLSRFLGGGFGQAMVSGAGLGVGIGAGETLINDIFN